MNNGEKNLEKSRKSAFRLEYQKVNGQRVAIPCATLRDIESTFSNLLQFCDKTEIDYYFSTLLEAIVSDSNEDRRLQNLNFALATIEDIKPANRLELMQIVQMISCNILLENSVFQARHSENLQVKIQFGKLSNQLMLTYSKQMDTLKRQRTESNQRIRVEHVHVEPGAQAVVGNIHHRDRGTNQ